MVKKEIDIVTVTSGVVEERYIGLSVCEAVALFIKLGKLHQYGKEYAIYYDVAKVSVYEQQE